MQRIAATGLAAAALLSLAACGGAETANNSANATAEDSLYNEADANLSVENVVEENALGLDDLGNAGSNALESAGNAVEATGNAIENATAGNAQ